MRKFWYPAFFPFFTMFSTPLRDQSHSLIHILFVLCRRFRLMSLKFYCLVMHISHKTLEIGCAGQKAQVSDSRAIMALLFNSVNDLMEFFSYIFHFYLLEGFLFCNIFIIWKFFKFGKMKNLVV